ncbi:uncharacterized protein LOC144722284 isoform X2 [Lampetra planeri]
MGNSLGCVDNQELEFDPTKAPLEATSEVVNKTYKGKKKNKYTLKKRLCVSDPEALAKETVIPVDEVSLSTAVLNEFDLLSAQDDGRVKARLSKHSNISSLEEALDAQDEANQGEEEEEEEVKEVIKETEVEGVKVTIIERTKSKVSKSSMQDSVSEMDQSQCGELSKDDGSLVSTGGSGLKRGSTSKKTMITTEIVLQEIASDADVGKSASMSRLEQVPRAKSGDHIAGQIHAISLHSVVDRKDRRGKVDLASAFQTSPTSPTSGPNPGQRRQILGEDGNESPLSDKHRAAGVTSRGGMVPIGAERYGSSNADFNGSSVSTLSDPDSGNFGQSVGKLSQMSPAKRRFFDLEQPVNIYPAISTTEGDTLVTPLKGKQERSNGKEDVSANLSGLGLAMQSKAPLGSMKVQDGESLGESNAPVKRAATPNEGHATGNADGWLKEDLAAQDNAVPFEVEMESATPALEARDSSHEMVSAGQVGGTPGRERLLAWARLVAKDVPGLSCHNFSSSWRDGRLLCAIVHAHRPGLVDLEEVRRRGARQNLEEALSLAESELGVPRLLDPEDVDVDAPDEKSIITYVSALHNALHKQGGQSRVALDANEDADEFWRLAASLRVWIEERTITLQSRTFPYSIDKLMVMQKEHALMKNSEFPKKKAELLQLEEVYKSMEPQLSNDGHEACRPDELHEAWSGLLNASANYEDAIVTEVQRLEMLQRLAQKMEVDTNTCAEGLNKVYEALQADVALINSGRAPQHGEEISRCLSEIEVFVQSLYPDVRTLTDGGCSQPELLQTRLRRLEEQVASLRAEHAKITSRAGEGARKRSRDEAQLQEASSQQDQTAAAYLQELLTWVQSNQVTVDKSGYGKDLDETTALLEEQKALHQTIENFRSSLGEAQQTMQSVSQGSRYDYSKSLDKLEQQYSKLLNGSRARLGLLENQQGFLRRCQREMLWLTQREEREVAYDWSDLNPDLEPKKEAYALLVRELEQREPAFREVVQAGEDLVGEGHPGNPTIQAYLLALKTQWSWLLQLCSCVETHLVENDVYFQFFKDARELEQQLRRVQDAVRRRYACDVSTPLTRLENLLQDAQEEKEQLSELKVGASKLHKRAKGVVQLKPRRPEFSPRSPTPVTALCNYHQDQVTLTKHDECSLSGAEDGRWTVSSPSGRSGTVPSVCFLVPAPNKEALDSAARVEQRYQDSVSLWKQLYGKMQGLLLWQHLHADMGIVMAWNIDNFRGLAEQDYLSVMDALESHYGQLEGHNEASQAFSAAEMQQLRGDVATCRTRYQQLLEQLVLEERTDEDSEQLLSDLAALSQRLRECQEQLTHGVRAPLDAETAQYVQLCLTAQEGLHREVESLGSEVDRMARKCEPVLNQGVASPRLHALRSQLEQLQHSLQQTHSLSLLYREKLSMLNEVKSSMEETERLLGSYEGRLSEESGIPNETDGIDAYRNTVRQWQTEVSQKRRSMRGLEEALGRALTVGERLSRTHGEACVDLARMRDATQALQGRWDSVDAQVDSRVRDLEKLSRILGHYRQSYQTIMQWVQEVGGQQEEPLPTQTADYQELSSQLNQHKELVTEIDRRQDKVNECQRYSEQYCAALKEYEMQLMEYRALVESAHSGPSRHQWQQSEADTIAQEFLDLRGRYTALVNLTGHRVKTISDSLQQLQQQEQAEAVPSVAVGIVEGGNVREGGTLERLTSPRARQRVTLVEKSVTRTVDEHGKVHVQKLKRDKIFFPAGEPSAGRPQIISTEITVEERRTRADRGASPTLSPKEVKSPLRLSRDITDIRGGAEEELKRHEQASSDIQRKKDAAEQEAKDLKAKLEEISHATEATERELNDLKLVHQQGQLRSLAAEEHLRVLREKTEAGKAVRVNMEMELKRREAHLEQIQVQKKRTEDKLAQKAFTEGQLSMKVRQSAQHMHRLDAEATERLQKHGMAEMEAKQQLMFIIEALQLERMKHSEASAQERQLLMEIDSFARTKESDLKQMEMLKLKVEELTKSKEKSVEQLAELRAQIHSLQQEKGMAEAKVREQVEQIKLLSQKIQKADQLIKEKMKTEQEYMRKMKQMQEELSLTKRSTTDIQQQTGALQKAYEQRLQVLKDQIEKEKHFVESAFEAQVTQKEAELKRRMDILDREKHLLGERVEKLKLHSESIEKTKEVVERDVEALKAQADQAVLEKRQLEREISEQKAYIDELKLHQKKIAQEVKASQEAERLAIQKQKAVESEVATMKRKVSTEQQKEQRSNREEMLLEAATQTKQEEMVRRVAHEAERLRQMEEGLQRQHGLLEELKGQKAEAEQETERQRRLAEQEKAAERRLEEELRKMEAVCEKAEEGNRKIKEEYERLKMLTQETTGKCTGIGGEFVSSDRGEDWGGEETADTCAGSPAPQVFSDESPSSTQNALPEQDATDSAICLNEDSDDADIAREAEEDPARDATFSLGSPLDGSEALHAECDSHRSASEMCADGDDDKDDEDETQGCELESPSVFSREHVDLATMLDQQLEDDEPEDASKAREGDPNSQEQQFLDSWKAMHTWLLEISDALSQEPGCDDGIDTLTERLLKLKELQGGLRAHEEAYEECVDLGELAVEAAALTSNHGQFQSMLGELRGTWEKVQALSAEREQSLEASLMLSGQLVDALQALSAWLDGVEPLLSPDFPVLGDMDTVARLLREHQALREELSEHGQSAEFVRRASRECAVLGGGNSCGMVERSEALLARWEAVCRLATAKETRLHAALQQAEELARAMTRQLEWCTLADRMLYPHDALPEEEDALQELAKQHAEWMLELESREEEMARISGLADAILSTCHPDGTNSLKQCLASVHNNFQEVSGRAWRLQAWLDTSLRELEEQAHLAEEMFLWLQEAQDSLAEKETELLPQDEESIQGLIDEHQSLMERMMLKQPEMDRLGRCNRRKFSSESQLSGTLSPFLDKTRTRKLSGSQPDSPVSSPLSPGPLSEPRDPHVTALVACWHQVWLAALERQGRLRDALQQSQTMRQEMEQEKFSFAQWRKLFSQQTKLKKSRLMDIFKRLDGDQDGRITRDEFAREISLLGLGSEEWELDAVVGRFGVQEGTLVDYYQFVSELCPSKAGGSMTDADKIDDEVIRKVSACKCSRRFQVEQVEENKYRFGDSQQLRLVRILRSTVMVRVGGGWLSLDDFLQKNDPCRAKGRTNVDLRERLSSGEGGGKAMVLFRSKSGGGKVAAPSRHNSTSSLPSLSACPEDAAPAGGSRDSQQASDAAANKFRKSGNGKSGRKERIGQLSSSVSSIPSQALSSAGSHKPSGIPPATTAEARPGNNSSSSRVSPTQRRSGTAPAPLARMATKVEPSTAPAADGPNQKASRPLPAKVSKIPTHASHATSRTATSNGPKH